MNLLETAGSLQCFVLFVGLGINCFFFFLIFFLIINIKEAVSTQDVYTALQKNIGDNDYN